MCLVPWVEDLGSGWRRVIRQRGGTRNSKKLNLKIAMSHESILAAHRFKSDARFQGKAQHSRYQAMASVEIRHTDPAMMGLQIKDRSR